MEVKTEETGRWVAMQSVDVTEVEFWGKKNGFGPLC